MAFGNPFTAAAKRREKNTAAAYKNRAAQNQERQKQKKSRFAAGKPLVGAAQPSRTNTVKGSARKGQAFTVEHRSAGDVHVYDNGSRVFVKKNRGRNKNQGSV